METTTTTSGPIGPVHLGATVWETGNTARFRSVIADAWQAYDLEPGDFLMQTWHGAITIGTFTGSSRKFWGVDCPTLRRYDVETYATDGGQIRGRKGERIAGTSAVRPEYVWQ